jgi:serine/threonine protein kinase
MTTAGTFPTIRPGMAAGAPSVRASENCLPTGTRLADFEILEVLGEGGFGIVYLAFDHGLRRTVAIKEFMPSVLAMRGKDGAVVLRAERHRDTFQSGLKSFINEARLLAQFDHPALVKVHRYWEQNGTAYTAMQYYEGRTIKDIVANSPDEVDQLWCVKMLGQVLQALEVLYTMQIVHRDVSPDNIIVQDNGEAVLLDFGSAREIIGDMTRAVTVILKPGYAPVEQYANDTSLEQGPYTDIYALCAVVYFAITRKPPPSSIARMVQDPMVRLVELAPKGYNFAFLSAIDQGLSVLAEERPRSIPAFRTLLGIRGVKAPVARAAGAVKRVLPSASRDTAPKGPAAAKAPAPEDGAGVPIQTTWPETRDPAAEYLAERALKLKRTRRNTVAGSVALAAAVLIGLFVHFQSTPDPVLPVAVAATVKPVVAEPHRTVVSAKDIEGVEEEVAPETLAGLIAPAPAAEQTSTVAASVAAADAPPAAPVVVMVPVNLSVKPWGTVYIDGRERGVSPPLKRLTLPAGTHEVRIVNPVHPAYTTTITLKKNETTVAHDFGAAP